MKILPLSTNRGGGGGGGGNREHTSASLVYSNQKAAGKAVQQA